MQDDPGAKYADLVCMFLRCHPRFQISWQQFVSTSVRGKYERRLPPFMKKILEIWDVAVTDASVI